MKAIMIILSYGARYEIPIFTVEQAMSYIKEYNEDNGFCYLYVSTYAEKELRDMADKTFKTTKEFCDFIEQERKKWINTIKDRNIPTCYHSINDFKLESVFAY